jgi:hypothetical protein
MCIVPTGRTGRGIPHLRIPVSNSRSLSGTSPLDPLFPTAQREQHIQAVRPEALIGSELRPGRREARPVQNSTDPRFESQFDRVTTKVDGSVIPSCIEEGLRVSQACSSYSTQVRPRNHNFLIRPIGTPAASPAPRGGLPPLACAPASRPSAEPSAARPAREAGQWPARREY